jgi:streptogramin lyase
MRISSAILACVVAGCGLTPDETPAPGGPTYVTLAHFRGEVDLETGALTVSVEPTAAGLALRLPAMTIPGGTPGVSVANAGPTFNRAAGYCTGLASGAPVGVRSNYPAGTWLDNTYAVIDSVVPTGAEGCNGTTAVGLDGSKGLWAYGSLAPGDAPSAVWAFRYSSGIKSSFSGRIVASKATEQDAAFGAMAASGQAFMAGTPSKALFLLASRQVAIVDATGTVTLSATLSAAGTGVAANADGSQIWVALGSAKRIARLGGDGTAPVYYTVTSGPPNAIAVDPASGVVWFSLVGDNKIGWLDPATGLQGSFGVTNPLSGPLVIVRRGANCDLYGRYSDTLLGHVDCAAKTDAAPIALGATCRHGALQGMAASANGALWLAGTSATSGLGTICSVTGGNALSLVFTASAGVHGGLAYGSDGNLWAMNSASGLVRIWLGDTGYGTVTTMPSVNDVTTGGVISGAGQVWAPYASAGSTNVWMLTP